jgi:hypothetical protein
LALGAEALPELLAWRRDIARALAAAHFDSAYHCQRNGDVRRAWENLRRSAAGGLGTRHLRLATRLLLTRSKAPSGADA